MNERNLVTINVRKDSPLVEKAIRVRTSPWPNDSLLLIEVPQKELIGCELRPMPNGKIDGVVIGYEHEGNRIMLGNNRGSIHIDYLDWYEAIPIEEMIGAK